jgi:hypothetical protein
MSLPNLTPASSASAVVLPETGSLSNAAISTNYPYGIYASGSLANSSFVTGASEQVNYTYRKLGGDVLDIELTEKNIFAAYEEAVLEYSYILNIHQAKNILHSALGSTTGTFDSDGERTDAKADDKIQLKYPKFRFGYAKRAMDHTITETGLGGTTPVYTASFDAVAQQQEYNLQEIVQNLSLTASSNYPGVVDNSRVIIRRVYYRTPHTMWRFYGYYGGMNQVGNMSTYGMYADDSTFEVIPPWHNKLQALAYEDAIYTRNSHYSYEIQNNVLKLFPFPTSLSPSKYFFEFTVHSPDEIFEEQDVKKDGIDGVNNMNTLPVSNIPYENINAIGKQWIRRFALAITKEMLGQVRSKFGNVPIPNNTVQLNGTALINEGKEMQTKLREELQKVLDEMTYEKMVETQSNITEKTQGIAKHYPFFIYQG